jgi:hypothetical protein
VSGTILSALWMRKEQAPQLDLWRIWLKAGGSATYLVPHANPVYFKLADMLIELGGKGLVDLFLLGRISAKDPSSSLYKCSLPGAYLAGVDLEPAGDFRRGLFAF